MYYRQYPWDLSRVPNYDSVLNVDVEDAERLDSRTFQQRYVLQNRPCLIKRGRAVASVPQMERSKLFAIENRRRRNLGEL